MKQSKAKVEKTNAVRMLDAAGVSYEVHVYDPEAAVSGVEVARALEQDPDQVFKTLVTVGKSGNHYVFMIPVAAELDLKKAAKAVGEKNIAMIKSKEPAAANGIYSRRLQSVGHEKAIRHLHR